MAEEGIGEGGIAPVNPGDGEGVLYSQNFVCSLLTFAGKVAIGELVAVKVLVHTAIRSVEDGEREARQASHVDFIRGEARGSAY